MPRDVRWSVPDGAAVEAVLDSMAEAVGAESVRDGAIRWLLRRAGVAASSIELPSMSSLTGIFAGLLDVERSVTDALGERSASDPFMCWMQDAEWRKAPSSELSMMTVLRVLSPRHLDVGSDLATLIHEAARMHYGTDEDANGAGA